MTELQAFDSLKAELTLFVAPTKELRVTDLAQNEVAADTLRQIKALQKKIEGKRTEIVGPLNARVKEVNAYAKEIGVPLLTAEAHIKGEMAAFADAEAKRRAEEQRRIEEERRKRDEEARKKAEEERRAREAQLEEERRIAAEKAKEEEQVLKLFGQGAVAQAKVEEEARALEEKAKLEAAELKAKQEREQKEREREYREQQRALEASRPKNVRTEWTFEVTDPALVPAEFLIVDQSKIRAAVRGGAREIPGVRIFERSVVVARSV